MNKVIGVDVKGEVLHENDLCRFMWEGREYTGRIVYDFNTYRYCVKFSSQKIWMGDVEAIMKEE